MGGPLLGHIESSGSVELSMVEDVCGDGHATGTANPVIPQGPTVPWPIRGNPTYLCATMALSDAGNVNLGFRLVSGIGVSVNERTMRRRERLGRQRRNQNIFLPASIEGVEATQRLRLVSPPSCFSGYPFPAVLILFN